MAQLNYNIEMKRLRLSWLAKYKIRKGYPYEICVEKAKSTKEGGVYKPKIIFRKSDKNNLTFLMKTSTCPTCEKSLLKCKCQHHDWRNFYENLPNQSGNQTHEINPMILDELEKMDQKLNRIDQKLDKIERKIDEIIEHLRQNSILRK